MTTSHSTPHPASDREALSALFDGELGGDAARFALKRLDHDQDWRDTCERWSLVGDLLRAQGQALLPAGFPARMRAAAVAQTPAQTASATPRWARWSGAGLAALVAVAALFFARQGPQVTPPHPAQAGVAASSPPTVSVPPAQPLKSLPDGAGVAQLASAGVLISQASNGTQRGRRAQGAARSAPAPVRALAVSAQMRVPQAIKPQTAAASSAMAATPPLLQQPIDVPPFTGDAITRPWPRAVLPQVGGNSAMAAGFGTASPSFYPFEPRLPDNEGRAAEDSASQDDIAP